MKCSKYLLITSKLQVAAPRRLLPLSRQLLPRLTSRKTSNFRSPLRGGGDTLAQGSFSPAVLFPPTASRRYISLHLRQLLILPPPHLIDPRLEAIACRAGLGDLGGEELGGDFDAAGVNHDAGDAAGGEVPHVDVAAGVGEGDVEEAVELLAHGGGESWSARFSCEKRVPSTKLRIDTGMSR